MQLSNVYVEIIVAISHSTVSDTKVVSFNGKVDVQAVLEYGAELREFSSKHDEFCVFDLLSVEELDSSGVAMIVECHRLLRVNDGGIALAGETGVSDHFTKMGFGNEMTCFSSVNQAVDSYTAETLDCDLESLPQDLFDTGDDE